MRKHAEHFKLLSLIQWFFQSSKANVQRSFNGVSQYNNPQTNPLLDLQAGDTPMMSFLSIVYQLLLKEPKTSTYSITQLFYKHFDKSHTIACQIHLATN